MPASVISVACVRHTRAGDAHEGRLRTRVGGTGPGRAPAHLHKRLLIEEAIVGRDLDVRLERLVKVARAVAVPKEKG